MAKRKSFIVKILLCASLLLFSKCKCSTETDRMINQIKSDYTALFLYDPECDLCEDMLNYLKESSAITKLIADGKLTIIAFYSDNNKQLWTEYQSKIPPTWINAYGLEYPFCKKELSEVYNRPALFLLDRDKNILLTNIADSELEVWLKEKYSI